MMLEFGVLCHVADPATCVFATTSRDHPIHLWDATTGEVELAACACFVWS